MLRQDDGVSETNRKLFRGELCGSGAVFVNKKRYPSYMNVARVTASASYFLRCFDQ